MDSEALAAVFDEEKVNANGVVADWENSNETTLTGDAWIQKHSQPMLNKKRSTKIESLQTGKTSTKPLRKVTRGFGSARSPC